VEQDLNDGAEHRLLLELLRVIRDDVDGGRCLTRLLFDRPQDEIDALIAAIQEVGPPPVKKNA
jgi:hypothetical protein